MDFFRKYYVPGMISLIFLPLVFIFFAFNKLNVSKQYTQEINLLPLKDSCRVNEIFPYFIRNFKNEYIITNDKLVNQKLLKKASVELNELVKTNNEKEGILFKVPDDTHMQEYINLYDWLYENDVKRYLFLNNYLFCIPITLNEEKLGGFTNCVLYDHNIIQYSNTKEVELFVNDYWKHGRELMLLYLLFLLSIITINYKCLR